MAGIPITSIGVKISYAIETMEGIRPTSAYKHIPGLKSFPELNAAPETVDTTTFDNITYTTSVPVLKDLGGAIAITANFTNELFILWQEMYDEYEKAYEQGKSLWFCVDIPDFDKATYLKVEPSTMGIPALDTNSLIEVDVYITPIGEPIWEEKPTYGTL